MPEKGGGQSNALPSFRLASAPVSDAQFAFRNGTEKKTGVCMDGLIVEVQSSASPEVPPEELRTSTGMGGGNHHGGKLGTQIAHLGDTRP